MIRTTTIALVSILSVAAGQSAQANPSTWITMNQALASAQQAVPGSTPIKAELDSDTGALHYEVKAFAGNILFEIRVNRDTGLVFDIDSSSGGGAQSKIAEAQAILNQSTFTLAEAIDHALELFPNSYIVEIEMRYRNGIPVFDADLVRGPYRIDLHFRVTDGSILKQQTRLLTTGSDYYNLFVPGPGVNWNTNVLVTPHAIIDSAQNEFKGKVFDIELEKVSSTGYRYELRLLKRNNTVVRAKYNGRTGALISSTVITDPQYVGRVQTSSNNAVLTLKQAISAARAVVPNGYVTEAQLQIGDNKRRYEVEFLTPSGFVEVKVNSVTGAIVSINFNN